MSVILVTGAAGFKGSNLCRRILAEQPDSCVVGVDSVNDYYAVRIKEWRLEQLAAFGERFIFVKGNIADKELIDNLFAEHKPSTPLREGLRKFAEWYKEFYMKA